MSKNKFFKVKKRFPTLRHLVEAGIITDNERICIEGLDEKCIQVNLISKLFLKVKSFIHAL